MAMDPLLAALIAAWVGIAMLEAIRSVALRVGTNGVRDLLLLAGDAIEVGDAHGRIRFGRMVDGSFVAPWLTILRWRPRRSWIDRSIVILPDMLGPEDFRRLRVELRWQT